MIGLGPLWWDLRQCLGCLDFDGWVSSRSPER